VTGPIGCREAVRNLWEYLDRGLDEADRLAVDDHLAFCRRCCGELEFAKELRRLLVTRTEVELPGDVQARLEHVIDGLDDPTEATP
jgi:anti-sigma factor (TIGR02949 family)